MPRVGWTASPSTTPGPILAEGYYATGISVVSDGPVNITNTGAITAYGLLSAGIQATTNYPGADIAVTNDGDIVASGYYGGSGIDVSALGTGSSATVTNTATLIHAEQTGYYGYGSVGIVVSADATAGIDNSGSIESISGGLATGLMALSLTGDANITNSGDVDVTSYANGSYGAYGLVAASANGTANVDNSGIVTVHSDGYIAIGVQANSLAGTTVNNSNSILAYGYVAYGVYATTGDGDVAVTNGATGTVIGQRYRGDVRCAGSVHQWRRRAGQCRWHPDEGLRSVGGRIRLQFLRRCLGDQQRRDPGDELLRHRDRNDRPRRQRRRAARQPLSVAGISFYGDGVGVRGIGSTVEVTNTGAIYGSRDGRRPCDGHRCVRLHFGVRRERRHRRCE